MANLIGNKPNQVPTNGDLGAMAYQDKVLVKNEGTDSVARNLQDKLNETVSVKDFGAVGDGTTDDTVAIQAAFDSGYNVNFPEGTYKVTDNLTASNIKIVAINAEIKIDGATASTFNDGGLYLTNCELIGGVFYTSGAMTGAWSDSFSGRTCVIWSENSYISGAKIYSQLFCVVKSQTGLNMSDCEIYGGAYRALMIDVNNSFQTDIHNNYVYNTGTYYIDKEYDSHASDSAFQILISSTEDVTKKHYIRANVLAFSTKQGIWVEPSSTYTITGIEITNNTVDRSGYYITDAGVITAGDASGTGIEVISAPYAIVSENIVKYPRGYNIALATGSDYAVALKNICYGVGGDPAIVVYNVDNSTIDSNYIDEATVGVSIGEDGATSNNTTVTNNVIKNCGFGDVRLTAGTNAFIKGNTFINGGTNAAYAGSFSGPGELYDSIRVHGDTFNSVFLNNNTYSGSYVKSIRNTDTTKVKLVQSDENYLAPIVPFVTTAADSSAFTKASAEQSSSNFIKLLANTGGIIDSGESTMNSSTTYSFRSLGGYDLSPYIGSYGSLDADAANFKLLFYVQYATDINTGQIRFGLTSSYNAGHTPVYVYITSVIANYAARGVNLSVGDWIPIWVNLTSAIHSSVTNYSSLTYFLITKYNPSPNYDLVYTDPVIVQTNTYI